jgi:hypothetical protein
MIAWEAVTKGLSKDPEGILIWHPGGHQGTHTALHCKNNALAVTMQDEEPQIGETFESTDKALPIDIDEVLRYAAAGLTMPLSKSNFSKGVLTPSQALDLMLVLTHGYSPSDKQARWIGFAAAIMLRLGSAALLGERRHAGGRQRSRGYIHETAFSSWFNARGKVTEAAKMFANHSWGSGFGGAAWLECTMALAELDGYLVTLAKKRNEKALRDLVASLNNTLNKAHNNGWWMNKFGNKESMDLAACGNPALALKVAPQAYQAYEWLNHDQAVISSCIKRLAQSRRLRCLSDDGLKPVPPSTTIQVDTIHYDLKGDGTQAGTVVHFQFFAKGKNKGKDPYIVHDYKCSQFSADEFGTLVKVFKAPGTKKDKSYAGSATNYAKPLSTKKLDARAVECRLAPGAYVTLSIATATKGLPAVQDSIGMINETLNQTSNEQGEAQYNEDDYYSKDCTCPECVEYFASKAPAEEPAPNILGATSSDEDTEDDGKWCDDCNETHC